MLDNYHSGVERKDADMIQILSEVYDEDIFKLQD